MPRQPTELETILNELGMDASEVLRARLGQRGIGTGLGGDIAQSGLGLDRLAEESILQSGRAGTAAVSEYLNLPLSGIIAEAEREANLALGHGSTTLELGGKELAIELFRFAARKMAVAKPEYFLDLPNSYGKPEFTAIALEEVKLAKEKLQPALAALEEIAWPYNNVIGELQAKLHIQNRDFASAALTYLENDDFGAAQMDIMYNSALLLSPEEKKSLATSGKAKETGRTNSQGGKEYSLPFNHPLLEDKRRKIAQEVLSRANHSQPSILTVIEWAAQYAPEQADAAANEALGLAFSGEHLRFRDADIPPALDRQNVGKALAALRSFLANGRQVSAHSIAFVAERLYEQGGPAEFGHVAVEGYLRGGFFDNARKLAHKSGSPKAAALDKLYSLVGLGEAAPAKN